MPEKLIDDWKYAIKKLAYSFDPAHADDLICLLYTSDAADDLLCVDLGGRLIIKKKTQRTKNKSKT